MEVEGRKAPIHFLLLEEILCKIKVKSQILVRQNPSNKVTAGRKRRRGTGETKLVVPLMASKSHTKKLLNY